MACIVFSYFHIAHALDVGFQGLLQLQTSDNIEGVNAPDEEDGTIQSGVIGIYGEQRGTRLSAAFSGDVDLRRVDSDQDSDLTSIGTFLGAAEFKLTPRSWTWYVGNILGGVRSDDGLQTIEDVELDRRNVFVTGPEFQYVRQGISRTNARALYFNQTESDRELEDVFALDFRHERELTIGSFYGLQLGYIHSDFSNANDIIGDSDNADLDFNRFSIAGLYNQQIGFLTFYGELGATQYSTDADNTTGITAELRATQLLGPQTSAAIYIQRELSDQNLSTLDSLLQSGDTAVGVSPNASGIFTETTVGTEYSFQSANTSIDLAAGFAQREFESGAGTQNINIDVEDRDRLFVSATWSQRLGLRLRSDVNLTYESIDFTDNSRPDNTDSALLSAQLIYSLSRSFDLEAGFVHDTASGQISSLNGTNFDSRELDVTENRAFVGLRWSPASRASQELTVELKSLIQ